MCKSFFENLNTAKCNKTVLDNLKKAVTELQTWSANLFIPTVPENLEQDLINIKNSINTITLKIEYLESLINNNEDMEGLETIITEVNNLKEEVASITIKQAEMDATLKNLQSTTEASATTLTAAQKDINTLTSTVNNLHTTTTTNSGKISTLENTVKDKASKTELDSRIVIINNVEELSAYESDAILTTGPGIALVSTELRDEEQNAITEVLIPYIKKCTTPERPYIIGNGAALDLVSILQTLTLYGVITESGVNIEEVKYFQLHYKEVELNTYKWIFNLLDEQQNILWTNEGEEEPTLDSPVYDYSTFIDELKRHLGWFMLGSSTAITCPVKSGTFYYPVKH